jgi:PAS domain-containing protein
MGAQLTGDIAHLYVLLYYIAPSEAMWKGKNDKRRLWMVSSSTVSSTRLPSGSRLENLEGRPLVVNPALCSMFGFSEEEMRNKHCVQFSPPEDANKDWAPGTVHVRFSN